MLAAGYNKEYLPIEGLDGFRKATVQLLLGADHPAIKDNKVAVVQVRRLPQPGPTTLCAVLLAAVR
jgi:aspartate/tyrosine/aromatic aminotransferase